MTNLSIGIIGGGVGGLAAATALSQAGHTVRLFEQAASLEPVGAGLQISPNGMNVLRVLGIAQTAIETGISAEAVRLLDGYTGKPVAELHLKRDAPDLQWLLLHRAELIDLLHQATIESGAHISLAKHQEVPENGQALAGDDLLIGADGIHSQTRQKIVGEYAPTFTGQVAWRAIISDPSAAPVVEVHMGHGRHVVSYPLSYGRRNIVAVEERSQWAEEGWHHSDSPENLQRAFEGFNNRVGDWLEQVGQPYLWGLFTHPIPDAWSIGRQVLLGDAAHPTLPFLAQGANMALEDAHVLRSALDQHPVEQALNQYTHTRRPRVRQTVAAAAANARNYHLQGPAKLLAHSALRLANTIAPSQITQRFNWLYRHDVTKH